MANCPCSGPTTTLLMPTATPLTFRSARATTITPIDDTGKKMETFGVKNRLTDEEATQYTIKNVMGGTDNWQPDLLCEPAAAQVTQNGNTLFWGGRPIRHLLRGVGAATMVVSIQRNRVPASCCCTRPADNAATAEVFSAAAQRAGEALSPMGTVQQATAISAVETAASHVRKRAAFNSASASAAAE